MKHQRYEGVTFNPHYLSGLSLTNDNLNDLKSLKESLKSGIPVPMIPQIHSTLLFHIAWIVNKLSKLASTQLYRQLELLLESLLLLYSALRRNDMSLSDEETKETSSVLQQIIVEDEYPRIKRLTRECQVIVQVTPILETDHTLVGSYANVFDIQTLQERLSISEPDIEKQLLDKAMSDYNVTKAMLATRCLGEMLKLAVSWEETEALMKSLLSILEKRPLGIKVHAVSGLTRAASSQTLARILPLHDEQKMRQLVQSLFVIIMNQKKIHPHKTVDQPSRDSSQILLSLLALSFTPRLRSTIRKSEALSILAALMEHVDLWIVTKSVNEWCQWITLYDEQVLRSKEALAALSFVISSWYTPSSLVRQVLQSLVQTLRKNGDNVSALLVEHSRFRDAIARCASVTVGEEESELASEIIMRLSDNSFHWRMIATQSGIIPSLIRRARGLDPDDEERESYRRRIMNLAEVL